MTKSSNLAYLTSRQDVRDFFAIQSQILSGKTTILYSPPIAQWAFPWDAVPEVGSAIVQVTRLRSSQGILYILAHFIAGTQTLVLGNPRSAIGKILAKATRAKGLVLLDDGVATLRYWPTIKAAYSSFQSVRWFSKYFDLDVTGDALPLNEEDPNLPVKRAHAVFLGSPLVEDSHLRLEDMLQQIQDYIEARDLKKIMYLPHPRETWFEKLSFEEIEVVDGSKLSLEKLLEAKVAPEFIATFCSSSLLDVRRIPSFKGALLEVIDIPVELRLKHDHDIWKVGKFINDSIRPKQKSQ